MSIITRTFLTPQHLEWQKTSEISGASCKGIRSSCRALYSKKKVILKTTFKQSQGWSILSETVGVENESKKNIYI